MSGDALPTASPPLEANGLLDNKTEASPPTNSSTTDSPPSSSPLPPESSPPPAPLTSPPPEPPPSPPPTTNEPPPPSPPSPAPPPSSPPPSSPPPSSPPPSSPPPSSPPPSPTSPPPSPPPPSTVASSPPPPLLSPPSTPVFSPPPPKTVVSQTPPSPHKPSPRSSSDNMPDDGPPSFGPPPTSSDSNINGGVIAGIAVGTVVIVALCIVIVSLICLRKRKKPQYYMDPSRPPKAGQQQYYNGPAQWHSPQPINQNGHLIPPPPGFMVAPFGGWGAVPSMQPPSNTSSDFSSGCSGQHPAPPSPNMGGMTQFSYEELAAATSGFSQGNLIGQGGFGYVHKGILPDRRVVACKSLKIGSGQGEREFQAEVEIISRVHHRHLVSLVGYCIANQQRMLVYEFVPNNNLEFHLHGKGQPVLEWAIRLRIAVGSAKGLAYLHEDCLPRIIHRDIKTANILLDNNFEAMVSDFGLAKLSSDNFTHVSTRVMGTFGYLAPEYASSGKLTEKSDVFSYGVMLLELITGRRAVDTSNRYMEDSLVDWARPLLSKALEDGNYDKLVDPRLEGNYAVHEMARMASCAAASIRHSARKRPKMSQIVRALQGDSSLDDLNEGVKPGQSTIYNPNGGSAAYDTRAYNADMLKFKKMVMSSTEFNSSEYEATTEDGINPSSSSCDSREMGSKANLDINKP